MPKVRVETKDGQVAIYDGREPQYYTITDHEVTVKNQRDLERFLRLVGGTEVEVGGTEVEVGGTEVEVGGTEVEVGGTEVESKPDSGKVGN